MLNSVYKVQGFSETIYVSSNRGERGNPTRKEYAAHIVSHELETLRFISLMMPLCVSVPKLYSI